MRARRKGMSRDALLVGRVVRGLQFLHNGPFVNAAIYLGRGPLGALWLLENVK